MVKDERRIADEEDGNHTRFSDIRGQTASEALLLQQD